MKQKVIVYNADGNSIRYRMTELEQVREHVFLGKRRSDTCGNLDVELVLCIKGVYFLEAVRAESSVRNESLLDNLEELSHNFMETVLEDEKFYPGYIILELFKHTGTREQLEILLERREKIIRLRKEEEEIRRRNYEQKRRQEKERLEQKHEEDYRKAVETFKAGGHIRPEWIMEMAARCGIRLHPKTIHNIHRHCTLASVKSLSVNDKKRDYSGVFTAIRKIAEKLNVQTDGRNEK